MQEVAARYQEGFSSIYMACAGTNTQRLIYLFENMFGDLDEPDMEELETDTMKGLCEQVAAAEKADVEVTEEPVPAGGVTHVVITSLPVPIEFGLQPEMYPKTDPVKELSKKDPTKKVTRFYYACHKCLHSSQNKSRMYTYACQCFNINLICPVCQKEYESNQGINKHITETHDGKCDVEALSKTEAEEVWLRWSLSKFC